MRKMPYTQEEIDFIKDNFNKMNTREISNKLGRSHKAIEIKANRLGLYRIEKCTKLNEEEIWKDVLGYEGRYLISNMGNVVSKERIGKNGAKIDKKVMKKSMLRNYLSVNLRNEKWQKRVHIHRLVAEAFIPNPNNLPQVNHIDENKLNNCVENLEWCTVRQNVTHNDLHIKRWIKKSMAVLQCKENGEIVKEYYNAAHAARETGISRPAITNRCLGKINKPIGGYYWKYKNKEDKFIKPILQFEINGSFVKRFSSISEAAKNLNVSSASIANCCKGIQKTSHGYIWKYE